MIRQSFAETVPGLTRSRSFRLFKQQTANAGAAKLVG
jgi:hypothetical protein